MTKRVLATTDISQQSRGVLLAARAHADAVGATFAICHVLPDLHGGSALFPHLNQAAALDSTEVERGARDAVQAFVEESLPGATPEIFIEQGAPASEIIRRAEAWRADLIVTGSQAHGLERALLGSVAARIVRYAHCPVLVLRPASGPGGVLAATDFSDPSLPALAAAAEEAHRRSAPLTVVHVSDMSWGMIGNAAGAPFGFTAPLPSAEAMAQRRSLELSTLHNALERVGATGEALALEGPVADCIVRAARERDVALVVVGTRGKTGLSRILLGSVAEKVVADAHCSVLAVRLVDPDQA